MTNRQHKSRTILVGGCEFASCEKIAGAITSVLGGVGPMANACFLCNKVKATCAREIVIKDYGVNVKLPFETPVEVTITPKKTGEIYYACAMDMIKGVLVVE